MMATCRSCGAQILWGITDCTGTAMPIDAEPSEDGNVVIVADRIRGAAPLLRVLAPGARSLLDDDEVRYMPHHATCPQGEKWRRKR